MRKHGNKESKVIPITKVRGHKSLSEEELAAILSWTKRIQKRIYSSKYKNRCLLCNRWRPIISFFPPETAEDTLEETITVAVGTCESPMFTDYYAEGRPWCPIEDADQWGADGGFNPDGKWNEPRTSVFPMTGPLFGCVHFIQNKTGTLRPDSVNRYDD